MRDEQREDRDIVDRAMDALRAQPVPDGPDARLIAATIGAVRTARAQRQPFGARRWAAVIGIGLIVAAISFPVISTYREKQVAVNRAIPIAVPNPGTESHNLVNTGDPQRLVVEDPELARPVVRPVSMLGSAVAITGHVYFHGDVPARHATVAAPASLDEHDQVRDESIVVNEDGTLQNAVVSISRGLPAGESFPSPPDSVVLDQKNCMFHPHVVAAMIGQEVLVKNSDPMLHSVHAMDAEETPAFNFAQPADGQRMLAPFQSVKTFKVRCDIHPWMTAWVRVFNHPYFDVTHEDGMFSIKDLPPGTYTIKAWHELFGVQEKQITVTGGEPTVIDFTFEPRQ